MHHSPDTAADLPDATATTDAPTARAAPRSHARPHWRRRIWIGAAILLVLLAAGRAALPSFLEEYVNRTLDQGQQYTGRVGDIDVALYRGAYTIHDVRIVQADRAVPIPLFEAEQVDLAVEWPALLQGRLVGRIEMDRPRLNFVDAVEEDGGAGDQTGAGGPWLQIIQDLFPFRINSAEIRDGSIHFQTLGSEHPVDVYLSQLDARLENLTNIHDEVTPLVTTIEAHALAMDHADFEYQMRLNPFSYRPTFEMAVRLLNLDVTELNNLARTYGAFDFERGWFDLVLEAESTEGALEGYVKPLFRDVQVLSLRYDVRDENALAVFWEALVGGVEYLLRNQPRDQFGTMIPFTGELSSPDTDLLATIGNILRNAFVRAYLPELETEGHPQAEELQFQPPSVTDPSL